MSRPQFSIRLLLLFVTALCIALGVWVVPIERQRRDVAAIEGLGGMVFFEDKPPRSESSPMTLLRWWLPDDYFDEVDCVLLNQTTQVTDAGLVHLQRLTEIQLLGLSWTRVTDAGLVHLQGLTKVENLFLKHTSITDGGLAYLHGMRNLRLLDLDETPVTDAGLVHLRGLTNLRQLRLRTTRVSDAGLAYLEGLTKLQVLDLNETQVTDAGMSRLRKVLPNCRIDR